MLNEYITNGLIPTHSAIKAAPDEVPSVVKQGKFPIYCHKLGNHRQIYSHNAQLAVIYTAQSGV